jgi:PAS domain S-box-containing protein
LALTPANFLGGEERIENAMPNVLRYAASGIHALEQSKLREQYKQAEKERIESEGKFRLLAENMTDVFWITSPNLDKINYVSSAYGSIWGFSAESLYANPHQWSEAIVPEDRERVRKAFGALMGDERTVSVEYRIARPDGTIRWVHDRGFQVRDNAGNVLYLTGLAADISERKKAEAEIENQLRELRRWRELTLGREDRVQSLKMEVNEALEQSGKPARYASPKAGEKDL